MFRLILAAALLAPVAAYANETIDNINTHCRAEWPGDFRMQEYCVRTQLEAIVSLKGVSDRLEANEELSEAAAVCFAEWPAASGGSDWQMVDYCIRNQIEAYDRLQAR